MHSENLLPHHGEAYFYPEFLKKDDADRLMSALLADMPWKQEPIKIFGKSVLQPRLTAWMADEGVNYSYSGITMNGNGWTTALQEIKQHIFETTGLEFNGALLNYYRNGQDSMGWHRDNEKQLGSNPVIGSVSFGQERSFQFRDYGTKKDKHAVNLAHGSFLLMRGETQHYWEHSIPKTTKASGGRINITFRQLSNDRPANK